MASTVVSLRKTAKEKLSLRSLKVFYPLQQAIGLPREKLFLYKSVQINKKSMYMMSQQSFSACSHLIEDFIDAKALEAGSYFHKSIFICLLDFSLLL